MKTQVSCKHAGQNHITPLILQAVPFTGIFGLRIRQYGSLGPIWYVYGRSFWGLLFYCPSYRTLCRMYRPHRGGSCTSCAHIVIPVYGAIAITALYIWGIVKTATARCYTRWKWMSFIRILIINSYIKNFFLYEFTIYFF